MKKILQESYAWLVMLVAMFAMSVSAWAQEGEGINVPVSYYYSDSDISLWYSSSNANHIELWSGKSRYFTLTSSEKDIVKVEIKCMANYWTYTDQGLGNYVLEADEKGTMTPDGDNVIWTGSETSLNFYSPSVDLDVYSLVVWFDNGSFVESDYTVTVPSGVEVSIKGTAVSGSTYHATEKFKSNDVVVTNVPDGYKAVVTIDHEGKTVVVTLEEIVPAVVTAVYPTPGEIRLDDVEYGIRNIRIVFEGGFEKAVYSGEGNPVPAGVTLTKDGTTPITINDSYGFTMWQGDTECYVNTTPSELTDPGTYVLHIPAGINTIGGKPTEEVNVTWTVVASSTFRVESYEVETLGEKWDEEYMKTLTGLSVVLPEDATFEKFSETKAVELRGEWNDETLEYDYTGVPATWAYAEGKVNITFATPVALDGNYNYRIAEGSIVLADGRYNKAVSKSANVTQVYKFNASSTTPQNWTNLGNNQLDENFEFTFVYPVEIDDVDITKFAFTQPAIQLSKSVVDYTVNGNTLTFKFKKAWLDANYDSTFGTMYDGSNVYLHVAEMAVLDADLNYNKEESYMYYWRVYPTFTMNDSEWCTYSSSSCFVVPAGYTAYYVSGFEGESVVLTKIGDAGKTLYYYNGYLLHGPAGKVAYETGNYWDAVSPNGNYLVSNPDYTNTYYASNIAGAYWDYQIDTPVESCKLYQLSYDNNGENLGFYTQTGTNGESIEVAADKAFLFVPERAAGSIKRFVLEDGTVVTGLTAVEVPMEKDAIYNLQGQRVNDTAKGGVYVKNGMKFIVK